jgi:hypothetical protein
MTTEQKPIGSGFGEQTADEERLAAVTFAERLRH